VTLLEIVKEFRTESATFNPPASADDLRDLERESSERRSLLPDSQS
jgi:hypothetical protein